MNRVLGPYALVMKIGEGGLANVYLALKDGQPFAVKCLKPDRSTIPRIVSLFVREIQIASHLSHPNILKILDHGKVAETYFAVSDLLLAGSLHELVTDFHRDHGRVPLSLALHILQEICSALRYLHQTSVFRHSRSVLFHGDLSLENILITREGLVRLADFGSAGQESSADPLQRPFGRMAYLPAEILEGRPLATTTDLYSLGVIAYGLFFGTLPFRAEEKLALIQIIREGKVPKFDCAHLVRSKADEVALRIFFNRALHRDVSLRFKTAEDFEEALRRIRFRENALDDPLKVSGRLATPFIARLIAKDQAWNQAIHAYLEGDHLPHIPSGPVESLAGKVGQRKHPRVLTDDVGVSADLVDLSDKARGRRPVHELGRGGMLVEWKGFPYKPGGEYAVAIHLGSHYPPITGVGRLLYEVSRGSSPCAGFQFTKIAPRDLAILDEFVQSHLESFDLCAQELPQESERLFVDLYFKSLDDFRKEFETNISQGGLFVESIRTFESDETVFIRIHLPHTFRLVLLKGKVVYCRPGEANTVGVGIQLEADPKQIESLRGVL